jgi:hypothetical protein
MRSSAKSEARRCSSSKCMRHHSKHESFSAAHSCGENFHCHLLVAHCPSSSPLIRRQLFCERTDRWKNGNRDTRYECLKCSMVAMTVTRIMMKCSKNQIWCSIQNTCNGQNFQKHSWAKLNIFTSATSDRHCKRERALQQRYLIQHSARDGD